MSLVPRHSVSGSREANATARWPRSCPAQFRGGRARPHSASSGPSVTPGTSRFSLLLYVSAGPSSPWILALATRRLSCCQALALSQVHQTQALKVSLGTSKGQLIVTSVCPLCRLLYRGPSEYRFCIPGSSEKLGLGRR